MADTTNSRQQPATRPPFAAERMALVSPSCKACLHDFQTALTRSDLGAAELSILENRNLGFGDRIVARVNRAKAAANALHAASPVGPSAQRKIVGAGYDVEQFDRFNTPVFNAAKTVL